MPETTNIKLIEAYNYQNETRELFLEYTDMLIKNDSSFKEYLKIQDYGDELKDLNKKYGLPNGRIYLAYYNYRLAGCIALKKINLNECEMKRLYVREEFRGKKIGDILVKKIIEDAKKIGYSYMFLDTLPFLKNAINLYKKYNFYEIGSYNNNPVQTSIYMKLDLKK